MTAHYEGVIIMKQKRYLVPLVLLSAMAASSVYAGSMSEDAEYPVEVPKISLKQAVTTAENHAGGKASKAELERYKNGWVYDVEVVGRKNVTDVKVDVKNGKVIVAAIDKADQDQEDEHDQED